MFQVSDKIVYPMHGAGVIEAIEEKEIFGKTQVYYIISMFIKDMQVMIPKDKSKSLGIREVVSKDTLDHVFESFHDGEPDSTLNTNQRYQSNMKKIKSGDIYDCAQVIRDLTLINQKKTLGTSDKMMLDQARQILISELMFVKEMSEEEAITYLDASIAAHRPAQLDDIS